MRLLRPITLVVVTAGLLSSAFRGLAAQTSLKYQEPPKALMDLVRRGLVIVDQEDRYRLHEAIRAFADRLLPEKEREVCRNRHSAFFAVVTSVANELCSRGGDYVLQGLHFFDLERENIRSGHDWAAARSEAVSMMCCK